MDLNTHLSVLCFLYLILGQAGKKEGGGREVKKEREKGRKGNGGRDRRKKKASDREGVVL